MVWNRCDVAQREVGCRGWHRLALGLGLLAVLCWSAGESRAAVPTTMHYQGVMADVDGGPVSDSFRIEFRLFDEPTGGDPFWWEAHDIVVQDGIFEALLGTDIPLLPADLDREQTYLEIEVLWPLPKPQEPPPSQPMAPRMRVVSNPYSLVAGEAHSCETAEDCQALGGQSAEVYVTQEGLAASGLMTEEGLEEHLADGGYCQGACYADELVQSFLEAAGFEPCVCYGDEDVQVFLDIHDYLAGVGYTDGDVQAYLDEHGYASGTGWGDEEVQAYLDVQGYQAGPGYSDQDTQAFLEAEGYVPGPGYSDPDVQAFLDAEGYLSGPGYSDQDVLAFLDVTGYNPCACYGDGQVQAYLEVAGYNACECYGDAGVQSYLVAHDYLPGPHYSDDDVQSLLEQGGYEPGPHYGNGEVESFLDGNDYHPGPHLSTDQCLSAVAEAGYIKEAGEIAATSLPPDGLDEVSNQVLTTTFKASFESPSTPLDVEDLWPPGVEDEIVLPAMGKIIDITVSVELLTASPGDAKIQLTSPGGEVFGLHDHGDGIGGGVVTTFDSPTQPAEGDLGSLDGSEAEGAWKLLVIDDVWSGGGVGATLASWSIEVEALDDDRVAVNGDLEVSGKLTLDTSGGIQAHTNMPLVPSGMIAMFQGECPEGWTEVTELRTRFPRGWDGSGPLQSGGADTAPHSHSVGTACGPGDCINWGGGYSGSFGAPGGTSQASPPNIPSYLEVVYCKKD